MALVQAWTIENNTSTQGTTLVFASKTYTTGNTLVVGAGWNVNVTATIADAGGHTWNSETVELHSTEVNGTLCQFFHIGNITGFTGTVTITFSGAGAKWSHAVLQEHNSMPAASNNRDQHLTAEGEQTAGPTTPPNTGNITTVNPNEVCFAICKAATGETFSSRTINSVAGSDAQTFSDTTTWNTYPTSTFTGAAAVSLSVNTKWVIGVITLTANAASGATPAVTSKHIGRSIGIGIGKGIFN